MPNSSSAVDVLLADGPVVVLNKPSGILTQAPPGIDSLEVQLKLHERMRQSAKGNVYLGIIHRLDRPASGVIAFALNRNAARHMSKQFQERRVAKTYWAFVEGNVSPAEGTWTDQLHKVHGMARAEVVAEGHPGGKNAILHYRVLVANELGSWLEIELETGRTHQIRVQSASRGHPVMGDAQYGATQPFGEQCADTRLHAIALHARTLAFTHPVSQDPVEVIAPTSVAWDALGLPLDMF